MLVTAAVNDVLLAVVAFAIVLIPAIIIHELGHFFRRETSRHQCAGIWYWLSATSWSALHVGRNGIHAQLAAAGRLCPSLGRRYGRSRG